MKALLGADLGFQRAAEVNRLLVEKGHPALVLVNGVGAIDMVEHLYTDELTWHEIRYDSCDLPPEGRKPKRLWHRCGLLHLGSQVVPAVGFPFLRTPKTHNSNAELALLGSYVCDCRRPACQGLARSP